MQCIQCTIQCSTMQHASIKPSYPLGCRAAFSHCLEEQTVQYGNGAFTVHCTVMQCNVVKFSEMPFIAVQCCAICSLSAVQYSLVQSETVWAVSVCTEKPSCSSYFLHSYLHCTAATALQCTVLHYIALLYTALHCIALHCTELHWIALHCTALNFIVLHCTAWHCIALNCTTLRCIALHCTALHFTALHCSYLTPLHCIVLPCSALHCT